jgi:hypothetical protein
VNKWVHNFRKLEPIFFLILQILRKGWGSGKYFSLEKGSTGEKILKSAALSLRMIGRIINWKKATVA